MLVGNGIQRPGPDVESGIPNSSGMNRAAISGTQRMAAPRILRITIPHAPLVRCRSIRIAIEPRVTPSHAMNAIR